VQKSELKKLDEERKVEIGQIVEKYRKKREAIIDALVTKEVSEIVDRYGLAAPSLSFFFFVKQFFCVCADTPGRSKPS
jgi:hypothetical protein